ncbi:MAG: cell division protein FtsK [Planctomycetes bacterium]|nr:cell division protein FtsK [Planctomycetota bacterium]
MSTETEPSGVDQLRARVAALEKRLREILDARTEAERAHAAWKGEQEAEFARRTTRLAGDHAAQKDGLRTRQTRDLSDIGGRYQRDMSRAERAFQAVVKRAEGVHAKTVDRLQAEHQRDRDRGLDSKHEKETASAKRLAALREGVAALQERANGWSAHIGAWAARLGLTLHAPVAVPGRFDSRTSEQIADAVREEIEADTRLLEARRRELWLRIVAVFPYPFLVLFLLILHAGAFAAIWFRKPEWAEQAKILTPLVFAGTVTIAVAVLRMMRSAAGAFANALHGHAEEMSGALKLHAEELKRQSEAGRRQQLDDRIGFLGELDAKFLGAIADTKAALAAKLERLGRRHTALKDRAERRKNRRLTGVRLDADEASLKVRQQKEMAELKAAHERTGTEGEIRRAESSARLAADWSGSVEEFVRASAEARGQCRRRSPEWTDSSWKNFRMTSEFPRSVYLGDVHLDFAALTSGHRGSGAFAVPANGQLALPLSLTFPDRGNLLVTVDSRSRGRGIDVLLNSSLRILGAFPPAKAKFLLVDPLGLGQSFSALMHLADHDDSLVGGRIWTEATHIEKKLSELTEHMEKVIQKYLRNKYATIDEYNREAGQLAEAYRFLVIADFPTGFSEGALERLASILTSGARCGVYTLILHDRKLKPPPAFDPVRFRRTGLVVRAAEEMLTLDEESLPQSRLDIERAPEPATLTAILNAVGLQSKDASRVEVPFEAVAPPEGRWCTLTAETGLRVPIGRTGADRLLNLDLGRGTAQHALVAGKTGSGKSTLFHVLITNAALWYGPRDLELYLIDFKKGVEFKRFATHKLPHARVVAIESDREFGLSVLRRIDRELTARAEVFRAAGVQDFAGYRRSPGAETIPRAILLIDEFQEFFTEEDAVAQEAALLLDRIVRQGRAFGVHVILGSQTLGGSYTLAKATLGQMGIRIALQCNEADSLLILGDDNAAARLLSRPGEAIYNDMSGMVEGNNPFQIVWLNDATEDRYLERLHRLADERGWTPREPPTIFEGNVPGDIRNNAPLRDRLARPFAEPGPALRAWVGEANAIKGPTEVNFRKLGGSNLLILGQQRESALSILLSSVVSLAAALPPKSARFLILDGSPPELGDARRLAELAAMLPHDVDIVEYNRVPEIMEALDAEVSAPAGSGAEERRTFLVIHDLQRFRKLRQTDEYDMSGGEGEKKATDKCLVNVLTEGPARGVHTLVWCDSLGNLKRTFSQKSLREFEMRILFQMSAADSSELIDTPLAGKLGLYRGLLYLEEEGTVEKFRPYAWPDAERMEEIRKALRSEAAQPGSGAR